MATEDFSSPATNGGSVRVNDLPPLWWYLSPATSPDTDNHGNTAKESHKKEETYGAHKKSHSCMEDGRCNGKRNDGGSDEDDDEEERMDMLWEDLNEELVNSLSCGLGSERLPEEMVKLQVGCPNGALLSTRMTSMVVIMKVLKKLLFLHSSRRKLKTRTW